MAKRKSNAGMKKQQSRLEKASKAWWALTEAERKRRNWRTFSKEYLKGKK
jgi:hypothetical protein